MPDSAQIKSLSKDQLSELIKINKEIYEKNAELVVRNRTLSSLRKIYEVVNHTLDVQETSQGILNEVVSSVQVKFGLILLVDDSKNYLYTSALSLPSDFPEDDKQTENVFRALMADLRNKENICVKVLDSNQSAKTYKLTDIFNPVINEGHINEIQGKLGVNTFIINPITFANEVIGVLILGLGTNEDYLSASDKEILSEVMGIFGIAIQNAKLYLKINNQVLLLKDKNEEVNTIFKITNEIVSTLDLNEVAQRAVDSIKSAMGYPGLIISRLTDKRMEILAMTSNLLVTDVVNFTIENSAQCVCKIDEFSAIPYDESNFVISSSIKESVPAMFPPLLADYICEKLGIKTVVNVPIKSRNKTLGVLTFLIKRHLDHINDEEYNLMQAFASQLAIALENARLFNEYQLLTKSLEEKNAALEAYAQKEKDILDILGHELRTPITIVRNSLSMLTALMSRNPNLSDKEKHYLEMAMRSTKREMELIETMLSATKLEAKKIELARQEVDLKEVILESIEGQRENARLKDLYIKFDEKQEIPHIYADRTKIQQISDNLLSNAVKYTNKGGVEYKIELLKEMVKVNIIDTGIGISEENLEKLGTKFYRVSQHINSDQQSRLTTVVRPGGTGLGLYVTIELIKLHGGEFNVSSKVNEGSIFSFTMPIYSGQPEEVVTKKSKNLLENYKGDSTKNP